MTSPGHEEAIPDPLSELVRRLPRNGELASLLREAMANRRLALDPKLAALASRFLVVAGPPSRATVRALVRPAVFAACERAFIDSFTLRLEYVSAGGEQTRREVDPHGLLLNAATWCIIGFDHHRNAGRTFRLDRIRTAELTTKHFAPKNVRQLFDEIRAR